MMRDEIYFRTNAKNGWMMDDGHDIVAIVMQGIGAENIMEWIE